MKRISLLMLLLGAVGSSAFASEIPATGEPNDFDLNAREIVVRIYHNWSLGRENQNEILSFQEPASFETVTFRLRYRTATLDFPESVEAQAGKSVLVITAKDQTDEVVRKAFRDCVHVQPYKPGLKYTLPDKLRYRHYEMFNEQRIFFKDAFGEPLVGASIEIYLADIANPSKVLIDKFALDESASVKLPYSFGMHKFFTIIVSHPEYCTAGLQYVYPRSSQNRTFLLPFIKIGTEADSRSARGVVLDDKGNPIQKATIRCTGIIAANGARIDTDIDSRTFVLSDKNGSFDVHPPVSLGDGDMNIFDIPAKCKYRLTVQPPNNLDLLSYTGEVFNDNESAIVLKKQGYFRTFAFEDADGPITDVNTLRYIRIRIKDGEQIKHSLTYNQFKNGRTLPLGTYTTSSYGILIPEFEPVEVTEQSPQEIVFRAKPPDDRITYVGRVVNGITGEAMQDVFVVTSGWSSKDLSTLTQEQWAKLNALGPEPNPDDEAFVPVRKLWSNKGPQNPYLPPLKRVLKTDSDGYFEFVVNRSEFFDYIVAFAQGYLTDKIMTDRLTPDANNFVQLPYMRMYPAATVVFEPSIRIKELDLRVRPDFKDDSNADIYWYDDFENWYFSHPFSLIQGTFDKIETCRMQIPAGLSLSLRFTVADSDRDDPWRCRVYSGNFRALPGETVELGKTEFPDEIPVFVQVLGSSGEPVEGVGVVHLESGVDHKQGLPHTTDADGLAGFFVPPYYRGRFVVWVRNLNKKTGKLTVELKNELAFEVSGLADANNVYTLQLSDEMMKRLFE